MSDVVAFAPGRVELLGNHTDYNEGVVLSCAIQLGITVTGRRRKDGKIICTSEEAKGSVEANLNDGIKPRKSWADYVLGVAQMLVQTGAPLGGFEAHYSSTLPVGAGLSSSAAMEVATAMLLTELYSIEVPPLELARICRRAENEFVGVNCGLLDQVSSIFGRKDHVIYLDCRTEAIETIPFPSHLGLLVVHSGVKHALIGGEYNERRSQCFEAAKRMGVAALRDVTSSQLARATLPEHIKRRAAHVIGENERVFEAVKKLRAGRGEELGALMTASHYSSVRNFENSTPELDALVSLVITFSGCYGARLTGGGFGGSIIAFVENEVIDNVMVKLIDSYREKTGNVASGYACKASRGAFLMR